MLRALLTCSGVACSCDWIERIARAADANPVPTPASSWARGTLIGSGEPGLGAKGSSGAWDRCGRSLDAICAKRTQSGLRYAQRAVEASRLCKCKTPRVSNADKRSMLGLQKFKCECLHMGQCSLGRPGM